MEIHCNRVNIKIAQSTQDAVLFHDKIATCKITVRAELAGSK